MIFLVLFKFLNFFFNFFDLIEINLFISEKPIKVPDWEEKREKNCLLDCNGHQGRCPGFCGGSKSVAGYCCSKDLSGTMRCPKSAKFAVTSDTNSCVTLNDIPDDDYFAIDEDEDDVDDMDNGENDRNSTMLIHSPQVCFL